jgi:hypothetical protein
VVIAILYGKYHHAGPTLLKPPGPPAETNGPHLGRQISSNPLVCYHRPAGSILQLPPSSSLKLHHCHHQYFPILMSFSCVGYSCRLFLLIVFLVELLCFQPSAARHLCVCKSSGPLPPTPCTPSSLVLQVNSFSWCHHKASYSQLSLCVCERWGTFHLINSNKCSSA